MSGAGAGEATVALSRDINTVMFEYKKDSSNAYGDDRVSISNLTYSANDESTRPDGNSTDKSSGGSGGAINWISLLALGMLALVRRRLV